MSLETRFRSLEEDVKKASQSIKDSFLTDTNGYTDNDLQGNLNYIPITFDSYQTLSKNGHSNPDHLPDDIYFCLKLLEEAGELTSNVRKTHKNSNGVMDSCRKEKFIKEAGDVLFCLASLVSLFDIKLSDIAKTNQTKTLIKLKTGKNNINVG